MATSFPSFSTSIVSSASPSHHRNLKKPAAQAQSANWWAPIFGWSSEPEYINNNVKIEADHNGAQSENESGGVMPQKKALRGCFTEEKAKQLRRKTIETSNFHDVMYHSAIASRLASDV